MDVSKSNKFSTATSANNARWLHIRFADGSKAYDQSDDGKPDKNKPCRIQLLGSDSAEYKAAKRKLANKFARIKRSGRDPSYDDQVEGQMDLNVAVSVGFENIELKGEKVTSQTAKDLYLEVPDIYEQVNVFIDDRTAFTQGLLEA